MCGFDILRHRLEKGFSGLWNYLVSLGDGKREGDEDKYSEGAERLKHV